MVMDIAFDGHENNTTGLQLIIFQIRYYVLCEKFE